MAHSCEKLKSTQQPKQLRRGRLWTRKEWNCQVQVLIPQMITHHDLNPQLATLILGLSTASIRLFKQADKEWAIKRKKTSVSIRIALSRTIVIYTQTVRKTFKSNRQKRWARILQREKIWTDQKEFLQFQYNQPPLLKIKPWFSWTKTMKPKLVMVWCQLTGKATT